MLKCTAVLITKCGCSKNIENIDTSNYAINVPLKFISDFNHYDPLCKIECRYRTFQYNGKCIGIPGNLFREYVEV